MKLSVTLSTDAKKDGVSMTVTRKYEDWATFDDLVEEVMNDLYSAGEAIAEERGFPAKKKEKK